MRARAILNASLAAAPRASPPVVSVAGTHGSLAALRARWRRQLRAWGAFARAGAHALLQVASVVPVDLLLSCACLELTFAANRRAYRVLCGPCAAGLVPVITSRFTDVGTPSSPT